MSTTRTENQFPLSHLPKEIRQKEIYSFSPLSVLGLLAQISKQYEAETALTRLLQAAINGAPEFFDAKESATALASIALLKKHPDLLFIKKKVTDHYGREIFGSPYQIFLGAGDIWALKQVYTDILPLISNGKTQAEIQFKEQFPNYDIKINDEAKFYDDRNKQQIADILKQLAILKQLIDADPFSNNYPLDTTKQAVEALCELFQPGPKQVIRSGLHFPLVIMKEIFKVYFTLPLQIHWSFFTLTVIKPALDALSTVDGQCCQNGFSELNMEVGPNRRCHSFYRHPLGKPLALTPVNKVENLGEMAVVDQYEGDVLFVSSGCFVCLDKNGEKKPDTVLGTHQAAWSFKRLIEDKSRAVSGLLGETVQAIDKNQLCVRDLRLGI